jgi:alpha-L-rhamnosidase
MYGRVASGWRLEDGKLQVDIEIPVNTHATVTLRGADREKIKESGRPLAKINGVRKAEQKESDVVLELGSGKYQFEYKTE